MVKTYKQLFNEKYGFKKDKAHSIKDISKLTKYKISGLQTIYNRGVGAYYNNPKSVRPSVKSPQQWSMARIYSFAVGGTTRRTADADLWKKHLQNKKK